MTSTSRAPFLPSHATNLINASHKRPRSPDKLAGPSKRVREDRPILPPRVAKAQRTSQDKEQKRDRQLEREDQEALFKSKYTNAFPNYRFYFSTSATAREACLPRVHELGAQHEHFFSTKVTHLITNHKPSLPSATTNKENQPRNGLAVLRTPPHKITSKSAKVSDDDLVAKAAAFNMKIWDIRKLDSILTRLLQPVQETVTSKVHTLNDILQNERLTGVTTERDPLARRHDYIYFSKNCHLMLIEDMEEKYATIAAQEYPPHNKQESMPPWPHLYLHNLSHSPFVPYDEKEKKRRVQALEQADIRTKQRELEASRRKAKDTQKQQNPAHNLRRVASMNIALAKRLDDQLVRDGSQPAPDGYLAASCNSVPVISGTGTTSTADMQVFSRAPLALRQQLRNQVRWTNKVTGFKPSLKKSKSTTTMRLPKRDEDQKPGYCESCKRKFEDFKQHIQGKQHRRFAEKDANFLELDAVLSRIQRRTLAEVQTQRALEEQCNQSYRSRSICDETI